MPAFSRTAPSALAWSSAEITGLRTSRRRSSLASSMAWKAFRSPSTSASLPLILGKLEQRGSIAPRHARHHGIVGRHVELSSRKRRENARPRRASRAKRKSLRATLPPPILRPAHTMRRRRSNHARVYGMPHAKAAGCPSWPRRGLSFATRIRLAEPDARRSVRALERSVGGSVARGKSSQDQSPLRNKECAHVHSPRY